MDEFFPLREPERVELLFEEIFNGFDVVVRDGLMIFDALGVGDGELFIDFAQAREDCCLVGGGYTIFGHSQTGELGEWQFG